ncbi:hypothetical protein J2Z76_000498 [Sedimentibacter acidaminivorans]|jgi:hypothetical protein|uniref:Zinc dependent phospholipase C n=1 Tax=Sedimentibacter acidaminivorans TaxID=913099 RepID=A0ABS4GB66_9FIRM|nr:hypothetical protein [Sedimentibacter acidaminivorans]MBP1924645.1 hypothetical protein [Sedimentibacter acidaminivorans]
MPPISTHMHFGKIFIENSEDEIDILSFILGIVSPDTFSDDDTFEEFHCLDEDGNIDVREFYEKFDLKKLNLQQKSFVLGYYSHIWFDEYYKFNASRLTVHNCRDIPDEELGIAVKNTLKHYDIKAVGNYYSSIIFNIDDYKFSIGLKEVKHISVNRAKEILKEYFEELTPEKIYTELIEEVEYMNFIRKSCSKIIKSL